MTLIPILELPRNREEVDAILRKLRLDPIDVALSRGELAKKSADVQAILADVAAGGRDAVVDLARKFDDADFSKDQIRIRPDEMRAAAARVPAGQLAAIRRSIARTRQYQSDFVPS